MIAEKTGWTIEVISGLTPDQASLLMQGWNPKEKEKPATKSDILAFKALAESAR